jgi:hypothetical protein
VEVPWRVDAAASPDSGELPTEAVGLAVQALDVTVQALDVTVQAVDLTAQVVDLTAEACALLQQAPNRRQPARDGSLGSAGPGRWRGLAPASRAWALGS